MYRGLVLKQAAWPAAVSSWLQRQDPAIQGALGGAVLGGAASLPFAAMNAARGPRKKDQSRLGHAAEAMLLGPLLGAGLGAAGGAGLAEGVRYVGGQANPLLRLLSRGQQFQAMESMGTNPPPWRLPSLAMDRLNDRLAPAPVNGG